MKKRSRIWAEIPCDAVAGWIGERFTSFADFLAAIEKGDGDNN
jgi:hypothetical protein